MSIFLFIYIFAIALEHKESASYLSGQPVVHAKKNGFLWCVGFVRPALRSSTSGLCSAKLIPARIFSAVFRPYSTGFIFCFVLFGISSFFQFFTLINVGDKAAISFTRKNESAPYLGAVGFFVCHRSR